jgi:hypothetical protein
LEQDLARQARELKEKDQAILDLTTLLKSTQDDLGTFHRALQTGSSSIPQTPNQPQSSRSFTMETVPETLLSRPECAVRSVPLGRLPAAFVDFCSSSMNLDGPGNTSQPTPDLIMQTHA